ncbi:MAG: dihydroorotase [Chloroflexi bacterium]|nr:MAG: dihydroorotase [Chloroflexota bacterium]
MRPTFVLRGVRVLDPLSGRDDERRDVWFEDGRLLAIDARIDKGGVAVIDLDASGGRHGAVLSPGFIDLHAHLREPGDPDAETVSSGARAAAAGGFTQVVAMANTDPPIDAPERVAEACAHAGGAAVRVLQVAALSRGLSGSELTDIRGCIAAGAVAISDDGRNAATPRLLVDALRTAGASARAVLVHPEDEEAIAQINNAHGSVVRCAQRPPGTESRAVDLAIRALAHAGAGRLHLQHLSTAESVETLRRARDGGLAVTAEVTPHHLGMWQPVAQPPEPAALLKVNPPLRTEHDRNAMVHALREGVIDAVATDHAPHRRVEKGADYDSAAPGMIGLETALAACITIGGMGGNWLPALVERLTAGPYRALGAGSGVFEPRLHTGEPATCVVFDPDAEWVVGAEPSASRSSNTPLLGERLRGKVLLTLVDGRIAYHDASRLQLAAETAAHA